MIYVIKNVFNGQYVRVDSGSGDFPDETDINYCRLWKRFEDAEAYKNIICGKNQEKKEKYKVFRLAFTETEALSEQD